MTRLILTAALFMGCVTPDRPPLPRTPAPSTPQLASSYADAIQRSSQAAASLGYATDVQVMEQIRPNYWRVRFGMAEQGSGKFLDVYFDGQRREVVETREIDIKPVTER